MLELAGYSIELYPLSAVNYSIKLSSLFHLFAIKKKVIDHYITPPMSPYEDETGVKLIKLIIIIIRIDVVVRARFVVKPEGERASTIVLNKPEGVN